jgi:hypothetical protein
MIIIPYLFFSKADSFPILIVLVFTLYCETKVCRSIIKKERARSD